MTATRSLRSLAALLAAATITAPLASEAVAKDSASTGITLKVFKPKKAGKHTVTYKLHGLKGRSIVSARLRVKKGHKTVTKPVKLAKKSKMHKSVINDSGDGIVRLDNGAAPTSTKKVLATSSAVTVARPDGVGTPDLVVAIETTGSTDSSPAAPSAPATTDAPSTPAAPCGPVLPAIPTGGARPTACWRPYAATSPFNVELGDAPKLAANSDAIVSHMTRFGTPQHMTAGWAGTDHDWARPTYWSTPSDQEYTIHCVKDWGKCMIEGMKVRIPEGAAPAGGGDGHMAVIDQTGGWEYDMWQVQRKATGGGTLNVSWGSRTTIDGDGLADGKSNTANAAGYGNAGGLIRAEELEAGAINHALLITVPCDSDQYVFPAHHVGAACASGDRGDAPAMGQRFQLNMSDAQINGLSVPVWKKTILRAMAHYGMIVGDTGGDSWAVEYESGVQYTSQGQPDKWVELAKKWKLPFSQSSGSYAFILRDGVDWSKLRVVDPCVSARTC